MNVVSHTLQQKMNESFGFFYKVALFAFNNYCISKIYCFYLLYTQCLTGGWGGGGGDDL